MRQELLPRLLSVLSRADALSRSTLNCLTFGSCLMLHMQSDVQSTMGVLFFVAINQGILGTIGVLQVRHCTDSQLWRVQLESRHHRAVHVPRQESVGHDSRYTEQKEGANIDGQQMKGNVLASCCPRPPFPA